MKTANQLRIDSTTQGKREKRLMTKNQARPRGNPRSWTQAWPMVTLTFAALLFGALAMDWDPAQAQEAPKAKTVKTGKKSEYAPKSKNVPVANSLTNGKKIDSLAMTKLID